MRIGIDIRELSKSQAGGFRTYLLGLLSGLNATDRSNEYVLYVDEPVDHLRNCFPVKSELRVVGGGRIAGDAVTLRRRIGLDHLDVVHFGCNYGLCGLPTPMAITVHDCIFLKASNRAQGLKHRLLNSYAAMMARCSVRRAEAIITISEYSHSEVCRYFGVLENAVTIPQGGPLAGATAGQGCTDRVMSIATPYFLVMASTDLRKNATTAINAFAGSKASREGCRLVVVCSHQSAVRLVERLAVESSLSSKVEIVASASDADVKWLFAHALGFLFASLEEGFGLPPLEAMSQNCPVLSSNAPAMPEVLADAALFFDPRDPVEIADAIDKVWHDEALRINLSALGRQRVLQFSWERTARETLAVYERIARGHVC